MQALATEGQQLQVVYTDFHKLWRSTVKKEKTASFFFEHWVHLSYPVPELQTQGCSVAT